MRFTAGTKAKRKINDIDYNPDGNFEFDPDVPPVQRFINFKASVIGRSLNVKDESGGDDTIDSSLKDTTVNYILQ